LEGRVSFLCSLSYYTNFVSLLFRILNPVTCLSSVRLRTSEYAACFFLMALTLLPISAFSVDGHLHPPKSFFLFTRTPTALDTEASWLGFFHSFLLKATTVACSHRPPSPYTHLSLPGRMLLHQTVNPPPRLPRPLRAPPHANVPPRFSGWPRALHPPIVFRLAETPPRF